MKNTLSIMILGVLMTSSALAEYKNQVATKGAASMGFLDTLSVAKKNSH